MPIKVNLHAWLSQGTEVRQPVHVIGNTISDCLAKIFAQFPKAREQILTQEGKLRTYVLILLNGESIQSEELSRPVKNGDEISIIFVVDGG